MVQENSLFPSNLSIYVIASKISIMLYHILVTIGYFYMSVHACESPNSHLVHLVTVTDIFN